MPDYKAIIFDLDGTAIPNTPNGTPSDSLVKAVKEARGKIKLCAATGRSITNAKAILDKLALTEPCVISAGTQIVDPVSGKVVWEAVFDPGDVKAVLEICSPYHYEIIIRNELMGEGAPAAKRNITDAVNVMYVMQCAEPDGREILQRLSAVQGITASGVLSWTNEGIDIHITPRAATKEYAIAELLKLIGASKEETIGVGDGGNDLHLFAAVGHRIAMGNAIEELKAAADEIAPSVDEDGLAWVIERYS